MALEGKKQLSLNPADPLKHAAGLSAVWQKCMSEFYGTDCRFLIPKEHGQLGKLKKSLGMKQATRVVEYAIRNWGDFARKAATNVGSDIVPPKPSVGWLYQYHAMAVTMLHEELQSIAKKQAEEEQHKANKEALAKEAATTMQELKSKYPPMTLLQLTPEQLNAFYNMLEDPVNEAWVDKVTEKYGNWRQANKNEKGIPCEIEFKKAA